MPSMLTLRQHCRPVPAELRGVAALPVPPQAAQPHGHAERARLPLRREVGGPPLLHSGANKKKRNPLKSLNTLLLRSWAWLAGLCGLHLRLLPLQGARLPAVSEHLGAQVQYYSTHHRSMYPHIVSTRETYLFTSHAGSPLCAWDLR